MRHSTKVDGRPSFQFYPRDWLTDTGLRMCSLAAKGLWADMLCLMFDSPERGTLKWQNASKHTSKTLAKLLLASESEIEELLKELKENGVCSSLEDGTIYSRRMVRDERIRKVRSEAGKLGAEAGWRGGRPAKRQQNNPPSSSSSSSSTLTTTNNIPFGSVTGAAFVACWNENSGKASKIKSWGSDRDKHFKARLKNAFWASNWRKAIRLVAESDFCQGGGRDGWVADVDWFLRPGTVAKLLEGKYANRGASVQAQRGANDALLRAMNVTPDLEVAAFEAALAAQTGGAK